MALHPNDAGILIMHPNDATKHRFLALIMVTCTQMMQPKYKYMNINELLKQCSPTLVQLEKILNLPNHSLSMYVRDKNPRPMPIEVQLKVNKYMRTLAKFILDNTSESLDIKTDVQEVKKQIEMFDAGIKKSNNPALVKDINRYYPDGSGYVHFTIDSKYYMTKDSECTIDGKTYEFNPNTKIAGMMSEKYVPTVRPKIDLPTATIIPPLVLDTQIYRLDGIADETAL